MRSVGSSEPLGPIQPIRPPRPADAPEEDPHDGQRRPDAEREDAEGQDKGADGQEEQRQDNKSSRAARTRAEVAAEQSNATYGPGSEAGRKQDGESGTHVDEYA